MPGAVILLVDDNAGDAALFQESIDVVCPGCRFVWVDNGAEALDLLLRKADPAAPPPDLVVLDICLPLMDGFQILDQVRAHPQLATTSVVMWSSSSRPEDAQHALRLGVRAFITKAATWDGQLEVARRIAGFLPKA